MLRYAIVSRADELSNSLCDKIRTYLNASDLIYDDVKPELIISLGGDGTMLRAINEYINIIDDVSFCGIHTGSLGFYTDFTIEELDELLEKIVKNDFYEIAYNMLNIRLTTKKECKQFYALNEARVENNFETQLLDVYINNNHFENFRGNGLNFATPSGSTGYNKSLGGAIIHPKTKAMQMCEIASINNVRYRTLASPLILDIDHFVTLKSNNFKDCILGVDSRIIKLCDETEEVVKIEFQLSNRIVRFARYKTLSFMNRVKKAFIN